MKHETEEQSSGGLGEISQGEEEDINPGGAESSGGILSQSPPEEVARVILTKDESMRFWSRVKKSGPDDCWEWAGYRRADGYGRFWFRGTNAGTHRLSFQIHHRTLQGKECACHKCDNPPCVNPAHLWAGSYQDNSSDMVDKGRAAIGSLNGMHTHPEKRARGKRNGRHTQPGNTKPNRGEKHGRSKVTEQQVREMRQRYAAGGVTERALAREYGLSPGPIHFILTNKTWSHMQ